MDINRNNNLSLHKVTIIYTNYFEIDLEIKIPNVTIFIFIRITITIRNRIRNVLQHQR